jgi:quercetin dioxygenase-like cupin family protein
MRTLLLLLLAIPFLPGAAQDAVTVDPRKVSVVFEDARVRVLRIRYGPHEKLALHSHPSLAGVSITASHARVTRPDGAISESRHAAGDVYWSEPTIHAVENLSDQPAELVEIEFKNAPQPAVRADPRKSSGKVSAGAPLPVEDEPHHHLVYENQYLRMLEVRLAPRETTEFHTHSHDNLAVRLSEAMFTRQDQGQGWVPIAKVVPGEVSLTKGAESPYTHRVRNAGPTPFRVIDVELLQ